MNQDLFGDAPPSVAKRSPGKKLEPSKPPAALQPALKPVASNIAAEWKAPDVPCDSPPMGGHLCRVGGGDAGLSDDFGRTWFCATHRPPRFFPKDRDP